MDQYRLEVVTVPAQAWLSVSYAANEQTVAEQAEAAVSFVFTLAAEIGVAVSGHPLTQFSDRVGPEFMAATGFPIVELVDLNLFPLAKMAGRCGSAGFGPLEQGWLMTGRAITTLHRGPYSELDIAHRTLRAWGRDNDFVFRGGPREIYLTDPLMATDPRQLQTRLYQPID